ncbi:MAG: hypothetical protein JWN93_3262 [Hyphomicrobiales bacterium]|nr:hypothetical protein [Hyphomicrobiales bacterium]
MAHDHHEPREHDHAHAHIHVSHAHAAAPGLSLLRMSVPQRLAGAGALIALLWVGVFWALN